ncbi:hypothetical protein [Streptomyces sp. NPDC056361]|uniref:hypothetical protein n=1 Tax=Streptomyces sp. NPDC056361 TaxID=3345795 RepID=UPI0035E24719
MKLLGGRRIWIQLGGGAIASAISVLFALGALGQFRAAARIDERPVRVEGSVSHVPLKKGEGYEISYEVDGRTYRTDDISLGPDLTRQVRVGLPVPLEVAADDPSIARVAGAHYPDDDFFPTYVLAAFASAVAAALTLWFGRRPRPGAPAPTGR